MNLRFISLGILIAICSLGFSQSCIEYTLYLDTQDEVDNFQTNYPGCTQIEGSLNISGSITNLNGLSVITSVGANLKIWFSNSLQDLAGLNNIVFVGRDVVIEYSNLINLEGLNNLTTIEGSLEIIENNALINLSGLENLTNVAENIWISHNPSLANLAGLDKLEDVGDQIYIGENHNLLSLTGLENLTALSGGIRIDYNYGLASLDGLNNLETIGLDLTIASCFSLPSLLGLESINFIGRDLNLQGVLLISDLNGLNNLSIIGRNLNIESNHETLTNLNGLEGLDTIKGSLTIKDLESLQNLSGLSNLKKIGAGLIINNNDTLTSLAGMDALFNVIGPVVISGNNSLTSLQGLENIQQGTISDLSIFNNATLTECAIANICDYLVDPNGEVNIYSNATGCDNPGEIASACGISLQCLPFGNYYFHSQEDIDDFKSTYTDCTTIEGNIKIAGTDITNLDSLNGIVSISGGLQIWVNPLLANLDGLINTTHLGNALFVAENPLLTSLSGLDNINLAENNTIRICANPALSVCSQTSICDFIHNYQGLAIVYSNAAGCGDIYQIAESCGILTIDDIQFPDNVETFPNPFKTITNISFTLPAAGPAMIYILNHQGILVDEILDIQKTISHKVVWDASGHAPGIYFYKIITESQAISGKILLVK